MSVQQAAVNRGVRELLHFTTNNGSTGIFAKKAILPNSELTEEQTLRFIFKQNSLKRKEWNKEWLNYVNLSVSEINHEFLRYSQGNHAGPELFWVIFAFTPAILNNPGVYFTTTNNIYPACIKQQSTQGFEQMFATQIEERFGKIIQRSQQPPGYLTTCPQAEVLYPGQLELDHLLKIYYEIKQRLASPTSLI
jgi:hypothetical protein